jgi:hypothetical protein
LTITVLLILAVLWAAVLVPPVLRARSENRRGDRIGPLRLGAYGRNPSLAAPFGRPRLLGGRLGPDRPVDRARHSRGSVPSRGDRPPHAPKPITPTQKRRRDVMLVLLGGVLLSLVLAAFTGTALLWVLHLLADVLLGAYLLLLVQTRQRTVPHPLPAPIPLEGQRKLRQAAYPQRREFALRRTVAP